MSVYLPIVFLCSSPLGHHDLLFVGSVSNCCRSMSEILSLYFLIFVALGLCTEHLSLLSPAGPTLFFVKLREISRHLSLGFFFLLFLYLDHSSQ